MDYFCQAPLAAFQADEEQPFLGYQLAQGREYSEATAARIDQDVQRVLAERHTAVQGLLTEARCQLEALTQALCTLLGPRPARGASVSGEPQEITVAG